MRAEELKLEEEKRTNRELEANLLYWEDKLTDYQKTVQEAAEKQGMGVIDWTNLEGWKN